MIFHRLSQSYKWTPEQIRNLTLQELSHYLEESSLYAEDCMPADVSLNLIRHVLFQFFGVKMDKSISDMVAQVEKKVAASKIKSFHWTKTEQDDWYKAGMPEPVKFLKTYRKRKNGPRHSKH